MKKILLTFFLVAAGFASFAQFEQNDYDPITFGIVGGASNGMFQAKLSAGNSVVSNTMGSSAIIGLNVAFRLNDYIAIRPGLFYVGKGSDIQYYQTTYVSFGGSSTSTLTSSAEQKFSLNYLELPLDIIGYIPVNDNINILAGGGPFIAKGLNGNVVSTYGGSDPTTTGTKFGRNGDFKSIDYGATIVLGAEFKRFRFDLDYDLGLSNILQNSNYSSGAFQSIKTGALYVTLGLSFGSGN